MRNWIQEWDEMKSLVGTDVRPETVWGADRVERGAIRRYLEPLEFDCGLHHDPAVARAHGHADCIAPFTSVLAFATPALREPGETVFADAGAHAQPRLPARSVTVSFVGVPAGCSRRLVADLETDYLRPVQVGERLGQRGRRVLACSPKQTSVGCGAFVTYETEVVSDAGDVVARSRYCVFYYAPAAGA